MRYVKLWKRIVYGGVAISPQWMDETARENLETAIVKATTFAGRPQLANDESPLDFAGLARLTIPYPSFWYEWEMTGDGEDGALWGALVRTARSGDGEWRGRVDCVYGHPQRQPAVLFSFTFSLSAQGMLAVSDDGEPRLGMDFPPAMEQVPKIEAMQGLATHAAIVFEGMELLSAGNTVVVPHDIDPKDARQAARRSGGEEGSFRYHVIGVRDARAGASGPVKEIGIMPRHEVRGHFARYGPDYGKGLLFGKLAGLFWMDDHERGDEKNGRVAKDYRMLSPKPGGSEAEGD